MHSPVAYIVLTLRDELWILLCALLCYDALFIFIFSLVFINSYILGDNLWLVHRTTCVRVRLWWGATERQRDRQTETDNNRDIQIDKQTDRQTDWQADRLTDKDTERKRFKGRGFKPRSNQLSDSLIIGNWNLPYTVIHVFRYGRADIRTRDQGPFLICSWARSWPMGGDVTSAMSHFIG